MHTALHMLAQLFAVATAAQFVASLVLHFRAGRQRVKDGVRLAAGLASLAIHGWLCLFPNTEPSLWQLGGAVLLLAAANWKFWMEFRSTVDGGPMIVERAKAQSPLASVRPFGLVAQPYFIAYMLGLAAFAFLGLHSIQYITLVALAFMYDDVCRTETGVVPVDLRREADAAAREAWASVPKAWRSALLRIGSLATDALRRTVARNDDALDTLPMSMLEESTDFDTERDGSSLNRLEATSALAISSHLSGTLSLSTARRLFPSKAHDELHVH